MVFIEDDRSFIFCINEQLFKLDIDANKIENVKPKQIAAIKIIGFQNSGMNEMLVLCKDFSIISVKFNENMKTKTQGYMCPYCLKLFTRSKTLTTVHLESHKGPVSCSRCEV